MWGSIFDFLGTEAGKWVLASVGTALLGLFRRKAKLDKRWEFIAAQLPNVYLTIEGKMSKASGEAKRGAFRARMDELLRAWGYRGLADKDVPKVFELLADRAAADHATLKNGAAA